MTPPLISNEVKKTSSVHIDLFHLSWTRYWSNEDFFFTDKYGTKMIYISINTYVLKRYRMIFILILKACLYLTFLIIDMTKAFHSAIQTLCNPLLSLLSLNFIFFHTPLLESKYNQKKRKKKKKKISQKKKESRKKKEKKRKKCNNRNRTIFLNYVRPDSCLDKIRRQSYTKVRSNQEKI